VALDVVIVAADSLSVGAGLPTGLATLGRTARLAVTFDVIFVAADSLGVGARLTALCVRALRELVTLDVVVLRRPRLETLATERLPNAELLVLSHLNLRFGSVAFC
jgi:hypothetical protein